MANGNNIPDELSPQLGDKVFTFRGTASGAERRPTWQAIRDLFKSYFDTAYQAKDSNYGELRFTIANTAPGSKLLIQLEKAFTVTGYGIVADVSGSLALGIRGATTIGALASIVASAPPALSSTQSMRSTTLTGWTTTWPAGYFIEVSVTSSSGISSASFAIGGTR